MFFSTILTLIVLSLGVAHCFRLLSRATKNSSSSLSQTEQKRSKDPDYKQMENIVEAFVECVSQNNIGQASSRQEQYKRGVTALCDFLKKGLFTGKDLLRRHSRRVFYFHRLAAARDVDGGVLVRSTVQFNLFGGSIVNLGCSAQQELLDDIFEKGEAGCFLLTESGAGVLSGLIVQTEAKFSKEKNGFILHSPDPIEESRKNWISQGYTGKHGVVIARLILQDGKDLGPHAFLIDMNAKGVLKQDMPRKTTFNSLDNGSIWFDHVLIPRENMLSALSFVDEQGTYQTTTKEGFSFYKVAQRLLSGRIALSAAALSKIGAIVEKIEAYARNRHLPKFGSKTGEKIPLIQLPVLADALNRFHAVWRVYDTFVDQLEADFANDDQPLDRDFVHRIACAKVQVLRFAIDMLHELKELVGAYSLMEEGAFKNESQEIFFLIRFAEGDSSILQQKMAKDALYPVKKVPALLKHAALTTPLSIGRELYAPTLDQLAVAHLDKQYNISLLMLAGKLALAGNKNMVETWMASHALVKKVSEMYAIKTIVDAVSTKLKGTAALSVFINYYAQQF